ncbi:MAG: hypothetical protein HC929_08160 [Leptolyngbyaceae cyanobacterium SM2_5_2]|nr:hypothetical protein [Leptolyngbyaceae cyanobacterium SM2_5_2]
MQQAADSLNHYADDLEQATTGLWYPSEVDAPLAVVRWPADQLEAITLPQLLEGEVGNQHPPEQFFEPIVNNPFWHTAQGEHLAQRYRAIQRLLYDALTDLHTYRLGTVEVRLYLIGRHPSGGYVGLSTTIVET